MVRITGGEFKGRGVTALPSLRVTGAKVRQALFHILGPAMEGARVLDAFAGSGAVGVEALSRGAAFVAFIERDVEAALAIRATCERLHGPLSRSRWQIIQRDVEAGLRQLARAGELFDVIFCDPPYASAEGDGKNALNTVGECAILAPTGWVIVEHHRRTALPPSVGPLSEGFSRRYGDTVLSFYRYHPRGEDAARDEQGGLSGDV